MIYCDYNSTAPISPILIDAFASLKSRPFYNPSSPHKGGKESLKRIHQTEHFLLNSFSLKSADFKILFHSGATEGIYTFILGRLKQLKKNHRSTIFFYSPVDHSSVLGVAQEFEEGGGATKKIPLHEYNALIDWKKLEALFEQTVASKVDEILLNITWANGETGMVEQLSSLALLKQKFPKLKIHLDATQMVGKHPQAFQIPEGVDVASFSGHKFGSLHGVGWSFYHKDFLFRPLFRGGNQQRGLRSGTMSGELIWSLELALKNSLDNLPNLEKSYLALNYLQGEMKKKLGEFGEMILPYEAKLNNHSKICNTLYFLFYPLPSDQFLPILDLNGLAASSGPACKSGSINPSELLKYLGKEKWARHGIRFSFSPSDLEIDSPLVKNIISQFGHALKSAT
ncbi:MAG: aminotransferase class V-fold PLP-dependent enzyme [Bacteriovoracaceae bacterium]|nr:aminotransferase class V-fold PLP-dependent enzyme [Bacteriovoracaceae bacterium]